ncbi:hypothetical protein D3C85_1534470 [compost metagenome]
MLCQDAADQVFGIFFRRQCGGSGTGFDDRYLSRMLLGSGNYMTQQPIFEHMTVMFSREHALCVWNIQSRQRYQRRCHLAKELTVHR